MKYGTIAMNAAETAFRSVKRRKAGREGKDSMEIAVDKIGGIAVAAVPVDELDASNAAEFKRDIAPRAAGEHEGWCSI